MNNGDNKGVKIQHHRYNNGSKRRKRRLHKGRVAGAIVSLALVIGLGIGGYKLAGKLSTISRNDDSLSANGNIKDESVSSSDSTEDTIQTVVPSIDTIVSTTEPTTTSVTTTNSSETTDKAKVTTYIDEDGNIVISQEYVGGDIEYNIGNEEQNDQDGQDDYYSSNGNHSNNSSSSNSNSNSNRYNEDTDGSSNSSSQSNAHYLTEDDISNRDNLSSALSKIDGSECNIVVLPLKAQGGTLNYYSQINSAKNSGVIGSDFYLTDMVDLIEDAGFTAYAQISVLYDNIYPKTFKYTAYRFEDGTGSWWDNDAENGGKPWLSPFADDTKNYLSAISAELTEDGIKGIVCTDVIFPPFREKDLNYIGDSVKSEDRYTALLDVLSVIENSANGQRVMFQFSLVDALRGNVEALKADELNQNIVLSPTIDLSELSSTFSYGGNSISLSSQSTYNKIKLSMELFQKMSGDLEVVPCIDVSDLTASQKADVIEALQDLNYSEYIYY